ncbi:OLC1v1023384C1 [Oldenlandia corymbosa var. corymbosa]|uniref:OLC1v1023384C1 n=1 Tax=Oldenlandia corymbosa var. corymbosa TaxID=529605 RepID=A0AAV1BZU3_OLDCO|nr:OLC1v1023384C1 [Oldenlandia corymbosa var. corymbosa]
MECIYSQNDQFGNNFELSQIDGALLMSFLEDSQVEEQDDHFLDNEKLSNVMRSLEAEINQYMVDSNSTTTNWMNNDHPFNHHHEEVEGYYALTQQYNSEHHELGCSWMDIIEMDVNTSWCMDQCGDEMDSTSNGISKFGNDHRDHYYFEHFNGVSFEDHDLVPHGSLWQEPMSNY